VVTTLIAPGIEHGDARPLEELGLTTDEDKTVHECGGCEQTVHGSDRRLGIEATPRLRNWFRDREDTALEPALDVAEPALESADLVTVAAAAEELDSGPNLAENEHTQEELVGRNGLTPRECSGVRATLAPLGDDVRVEQVGQNLISRDR